MLSSGLVGVSTQKTWAPTDTYLSNKTLWIWTYQHKKHVVLYVYKHEILTAAANKKEWSVQTTELSLLPHPPTGACAETI